MVLASSTKKCVFKGKKKLSIVGGCVGGWGVSELAGAESENFKGVVLETGCLLKV